MKTQMDGVCREYFPARPNKHVKAYEAATDAVSRAKAAKKYWLWRQRKALARMSANYCRGQYIRAARREISLQMAMKALRDKQGNLKEGDDRFPLANATLQKIRHTA